ncbi:MAG: cellulase family glycosylhydrolase, partial [Bacteroidota bacterium]
VERHGQLRVEGNRIKDECGRNAQLKGMSYFWHQWEGSEYWNANAIKWLRDDWKVEIVRAAMGVRGSGGDYISDPVGSANKVRTVVDGAIQHGIYVIIDFHAHPNYKAEAKTFFRQMAQEYGSYPNVIYEIWNEPIGDYNNAVDTWNEIKQYAREVIAEIRAHDPDNIIVVGTPFYSQRVDVAADNRLTTDINGNPVGNVAYTIHAYAGAHKQSLRDMGTYALNQGVALFMTECGRVGTNYGPNNNIDPAEWDRWEEWMDDNAISYCKWSLSNKNEVSSSLQPGAPANGNWNYNTHLTSEGRWNRDHFRAVNTSPSVCGGTDDIVSISAPNSITRGNNATITVDYSASTNRDIHVVFQLDSSPWTNYGTKKVDVSAGSGTLNINVPINANTPVANDAYQFQVFITTNNGSWSNRLDNIAKTNVDCVSGSGSITMRARGNCGSETMVLEVGGSNVKTWNNVSTSYSNYTYNGYTGGTIKVKFTNDGNSGCDRNLYIDYIDVCGTRIQSESSSVVQTANWSNGDKQILFTNGNNNYGNPGCSGARTEKQKSKFAEEEIMSEDKVHHLSIFPNPVSSEGLTVQLSNEGDRSSEITITDIRGSEIYRTTATPNEKLQIPLGAFRGRGLYLLKVENEQGSTLRKIVVRE